VQRFSFSAFQFSNIKASQQWQVGVVRKSRLSPPLHRDAADEAKRQERLLQNNCSPAAASSTSFTAYRKRGAKRVAVAR